MRPLRKRQEGDATLFPVVPAPYPKSEALLVIGVVLSVIALTGGAVSLLIPAGACFWFGYTDPRPMEHQAAATFRVTPGSIESSAGTFKKTDIDQLTIKTIRRSPKVVPSLSSGSDIGHVSRLSPLTYFAPLPSSSTSVATALSSMRLKPIFTLPTFAIDVVLPSRRRLTSRAFSCQAGYPRDVPDASRFRAVKACGLHG